jgi:hypothetical protein
MNTKSKVVISLFFAIFTVARPSYGDTLANWTSPTSGTLRSASFTVSGNGFAQNAFLDSVDYSNLFDSRYAFSPISNIPAYWAGDTVSVNFNKTVNLTLYTIYWRGAVGGLQLQGGYGVPNTGYTLTTGGAPLPRLSILSGSPLSTISGNNKLNVDLSDYFASNVIYIGPVTSLDIQPILDAGGYQGLTFAILGGASASDTQSSLELSVNKLKNVYALQTAAITSGLTYDCSIFDKNDICISAGGRYDRVNTGETKAANGLLIGAYRVNPNIRLGVWVDQNLSVNTEVGVSLSNSKPMFGLFGVWNANPSGQGLELKVAAGYGDKDLTVTRDVIGTSEAGTGITRLNTQGVSAVVSYHLPLHTNVMVSPYLGMRYTKLRMGAYTEQTSDAVVEPLTYSELKQESSTALAGVKLSSKLMPNFGVFGGIGAELDTTTRGNNYSATGIDGVMPIALNPNIKRLRGSANAGFYLDIDKTQRLSVSTVYREEAFSSTSTLSSMLTYTAGF